jgi:tetratricopeptide (TPR) repeat protein
LSTGNVEGAISDATEALRTNQDYVGAWGLRGAAKQLMHDHVGAVADCRKALELDPTIDWVRSTMEASRAAEPEATAEVIQPEVPEPREEEPATTEPMPSTERLHELIKGVYQRKNPEKLPELDRLLGKYVGKEMTMYRFVCKKYGEKPVVFVDSESPSSIAEEPPVPQHTEHGPETGCTGADTGVRHEQDCSTVAKQEQENAKDIVQTAEMSSREYGNILFKRGRLQKAIAAYDECCATGEEGWVLALSNRAICHLKLKQYDEALSVADRCVEQEGVHEVPLKVHLTKFKALVELHRWVEAFATLRRLRARGELPVDVVVAAIQEEVARRRQFAEWLLQEWSSSEEEDEDAEFCGDPAAVSRCLARAVKFVLPQDLTVKTIHLVSVFGETAELFTDAIATKALLDCDGIVRTVKREEVCKESDDVPDLVVLCRPNLSSALELWAPVIQHLVQREIQTVVTGFSDQSLIQNEDVLETLGCSIICSTRYFFDPELRRQVEEDSEEHDDLHPHHHALAFKGGLGREAAEDFVALKQTFTERGFDVQLSD